MEIQPILENLRPEPADLVRLLECSGQERKLLFERADSIRRKEVGNKVYFRGLVEFSNRCRKDCYYCGIRRSNRALNRYDMSDDEILEAARFAHEHRYGSMVLQSGEKESAAFTGRIERLLKAIKKLSGGSLGITLSVGEQNREVYQRWFDAGAHRYLLRIETSDPGLYRRLHPDNDLHRHGRRLECLYTLKSIGYQTGTGVMIGLPFQDTGHLAGDLLFMKEYDVDMVGMGPFIEHPDTPLFRYRNDLVSAQERFELSLRMIAILRLLMRDINIAATTALQAIDPLGREKAVRAGANVVMPNITPGPYRNDYALYQNKPCTGEETAASLEYQDARLQLDESEIGYGEWGDSLHFGRRTENART